MKISLHSFRKEKLEKELISQENIFAQLKDAQLEIATAEKLFQFVSDPLQVDQSILAGETGKKKYSFLMKKIRNDKKCSQRICLIRPWYMRDTAIRRGENT